MTVLCNKGITMLHCISMHEHLHTVTDFLCFVCLCDRPSGHKCEPYLSERTSPAIVAWMGWDYVTVWMCHSRLYHEIMAHIYSPVQIYTNSVSQSLLWLNSFEQFWSLSMMCLISVQLPSLGLTNLGNTCFLNATVQMLRSASVVRQTIEAHTQLHRRTGMQQFFKCPLHTLQTYHVSATWIPGLRVTCHWYRIHYVLYMSLLTVSDCDGDCWRSEIPLSMLCPWVT